MPRQTPKAETELARLEAALLDLDDALAELAQLARLGTLAAEGLHGLHADPRAEALSAYFSLLGERIGKARELSPPHEPQMNAALRPGTEPPR